MFSLREYLTNLHTLPNGCVNETNVQRALEAITKACQTWGKNLRLKEIMAQIAL